MRCPLKVRLLRDDFGRLVFLYALKRTDSVLNLCELIIII